MMTGMFLHASFGTVSKSDWTRVGRPKHELDPSFSGTSLTVVDDRSVKTRPLLLSFCAKKHSWASGSGRGSLSVGGMLSSEDDD